MVTARIERGTFFILGYSSLQLTPETSYQTYLKKWEG
jgi:hypothetical protein